MGVVSKLLSGLLGGGSAPKADTAPATNQVNDEAAKSKAARAALLSNEGGQAGSQLQPGEVTKTQTIFGN